MTDERSFSARVSSMRAEFDESFARPATIQLEETIELVLLSTGGAMFAVRASEISGIHRLGKIVEIPGAPKALYGVTGLRGRIVPVMNTAAMLGRTNGDEPRWMCVRALRDGGLGFAFTRVDAHVRVSPRDLEPAPRGVIFRQPDRACAVLEMKELAAAAEHLLAGAKGSE